jgi:hypothetical protein
LQNKNQHHYNLLLACANPKSPFSIPITIYLLVNMRSSSHNSHTPSLCGAWLTNKRSLIAFTWSLATLLTLATIVLAAAMIVRVHARYVRLEHYYAEQVSYNNNNNDGENNNNNNEAATRAYEEWMQLSQVSSKSVVFVAIYTIITAITLGVYGSTAIVGFTSLRGVYIAPCFSNPNQFKVGVFGGAIVLFANLLLVCAVVFGEVRVEDWKDHNNNNNNEEERMPYQVERIAAVLAVTCMFLAALYTIFAILLFLYYGTEDARNFELEEDEDVVKPRSAIAMGVSSTITNGDPRREKFLTMQGELS